MAVRVETREPTQGASRTVDARAANDRIAAKAHLLRFVSRVPMLCECSAPGCRTLLMVSLDAYDEIRRGRDDFLGAPGHEIDGAELHTTTPDYEVRRRVRRDRRARGDRRIV